MFFAHFQLGFLPSSYYLGGTCFLGLGYVGIFTYKKIHLFKVDISMNFDIYAII